MEPAYQKQTGHTQQHSTPSASSHRASAFKEKPNNPYKQESKTKLNTMNGIHICKNQCIP
jgi:hypothetical protein